MVIFFLYKVEKLILITYYNMRKIATVVFLSRLRNVENDNFLNIPLRNVPVFLNGSGTRC